MMHLLIKWTIKFSIFLMFYIVGSRILSVPEALILHFPRFIVFLMVFCLDLLQIPMFYYIYIKGLPQIKFLKILFSKLPTPEKFQKSRLGKTAQYFGSVGVIFIAFLPSFGGGIWTSVLFAHILRLDYRHSFLFIAIGSLLGCWAVVYGFDAIFRHFDIILHFIGMKV